jgi:3',5'-cyclic AMP phosphodiesterase CpdA
VRILVHLSDLHFGRIDHALIKPLLELVARIGPDLVAVSGDLTQRARSEQSARRCRRAAVAADQVPGNRRAAAYVLRRQPLDDYRRYVTGDLEPFFADDEIAILGLNTARSLTIKKGRINEDQLARVRSRFASLGTDVTKIIVTHHPFDLPTSHSDRHLVGRARMAMATFANCGIDMLLAGHLHIGHTGNTAAVRTAVIGACRSAGTAPRHRTENQFVQCDRIDGPSIVVERFD